jgi:REP element-mobilizing transposase RayT
VGPLLAHVIFVTRGRKSLFLGSDLASICLEAIRESSTRVRVDLIAYCLMPDHVHMLVDVPEGVSLQRWAKTAKQLSGFRLRRKTGEPAWQVSYYDHILLREEALLDVAKYIWMNPVTAGSIRLRLIGGQGRRTCSRRPEGLQLHRGGSREEALIDVARYIWMNPVTAGLVDSPQAYRWSGPADLLAQV